MRAGIGADDVAHCVANAVQYRFSSRMAWRYGTCRGPRFSVATASDLERYKGVIRVTSGKSRLLTAIRVGTVCVGYGRNSE
jgi:hypothetical protein